MNSAFQTQELPTLSDLRLDHFTPLIGSEFSLQLPEGGTIILELDEARAFDRYDLQEGFRRPFSVIFRCPTLPANQYLRQGTYRIQQHRLGTFDILITPITPDSSGMRYEAVFS
ncbi:MAG: hypothetical protein JWR16_2760 [Nevskia sp.]|nr:hypothetical protein [Nevskia sp.]